VANVDCVIVGYNESPFLEYESTLRQYGEDSEAYRDLKYSFVELEGEKLNYVDLMNRVYAQAHGERHREIRSGDILNLAAAYLTSFLRKRGRTVRLVNLFQYEREQFAAWLREGVTAVAITTTFYVLNDPVIEMIRFIRQHDPAVRIVVGGPLIANHVRRYQGDELAVVLDDLGADAYVVEGQGEATLARILECWLAGRDLAEVPNVIYPGERAAARPRLALIDTARAGRYRVNPRVPEDNSLEENRIDWRELATGPLESLGPTLQTRTARSCAFSCAFCAYPLRAGKLTLTSVDSVLGELDSMAELGVKNVVFIDDTFNVPLKRFKELCRGIIERRYGFQWFSYFRCSNSDDEAIDLAAESGCRGVFLGIESGSPRILENMHKAATIEKYEQGIRRLRAHDILTFASFIVGFPGETEQTVQETAEFLRRAQPDFFRAQLWYCEPGTPIDSRRDEFAIQGQGFSWRHATMESLEAMDLIDQLFLGVEHSTWLPQWSFDFWIIPYLLGRGVSIDQFTALMKQAHQLLRFEIAQVDPEDKRRLQRACLDHMIARARSSA
jgi:radical SAM PhpK family P-methyltransferase